MSESNSIVENTPIEEQQQLPAAEETIEESQSEIIENTPIPDSDADDTTFKKYFLKELVNIFTISYQDVYF